MRTPGVTQMTALVPVEEGHLEELGAALRALPTGDHSPFERVDGTHFARLVVVDHLGPDGERGLRIELRPARLMLAVDCDADARGYLAGACRSLGEVTEQVFSHCTGFPGAADPERFAAWVLSYEIRPSLPFAGATARLPEIREGLEIRERLVHFALGAQGLDAHALRESWRKEFGW